MCELCVLLHVCCSEETAVIEYAALCLVALAKYYSCKRQICEQKGVELLIRGLSSSDPDVQKNCIEVIALVLEVFCHRLLAYS